MSAESEVMARLRKLASNAQVRIEDTVPVRGDDLRTALARAALHDDALDVLESLAVLNGSGYAGGAERSCWCPPNGFAICRNTPRCLQAHAVLERAGRR